ncbi:membrane or secreted protein [Stieleria sp. TO1_6]|uniref:membrane or secreted protein n=1 Tax=Stieleria tagensis TaxID=2956795 RepID=UPI00209AE514|nr:membrane or secreted protein [Stieleria tagensis]MCO8120876.1 membrane or secreted protein [Stieleria tagensis]
MFHSCFIRTVVNLSLIVAMMIQPGIALVFADDCRANGASAFTCEGCGCCEVSTATEQCGCCDGHSEQQTAGECCMDSGGSSTPQTMDEGDSVQASLTPVIVLSTADSQQPGPHRIVTGCHCGFQSQPMGEPSPVRPVIEQRESVAVRFTDLAAIFGEVVSGLPRVVRTEDAPAPRHSRQIDLCIWRL